MIKHFCDICGAPANERDTDLTYPFGKPYRAYRQKFGDSTYQPKCDVRVSFLADDHQTVGDGESLDLCVDCQIKLLEDLTDKLVKQKLDSAPVASS